MSTRRTKKEAKRPKDKWVFVEWHEPNGESGYHGASYQESYLPTVLAALKARGVPKVMIDEKEERKL